MLTYTDEACKNLTYWQGRGWLYQKWPLLQIETSEEQQVQECDQSPFAQCQYEMLSSQNTTMPSCWGGIWSWKVTVKKRNTELFFVFLNESATRGCESFQGPGFHSSWSAGGVCLCHRGSPRGLNRTTKAQEKGSAPLESLPYYWYICTGLIWSRLHSVMHEYCPGLLWNR